jgi:hypothetical protein
MAIKDVPEGTLDRLRQWRWDGIIEKHEGPESWDSILKWYDPEFLRIGEFDVLLPTEGERLPNIRVLRCVESTDRRVLTIFLRDSTYIPSDDPEADIFWGGRLAVCERFPGESFFVATVYHEWFVIENPE